jgi:hypothetical protein
MMMPIYTGNRIYGRYRQFADRPSPLLDSQINQLPAHLAERVAHADERGAQ